MMSNLGGQPLIYLAFELSQIHRQPPIQYFFTLGIQYVKSHDKISKWKTVSNLGSYYIEMNLFF